MGILRLFLAVLAMPFAVALTLVFHDTFRAAASAEGSFAILLSAGGGFALFLALYALSPKRPVRMYILGHELTHALFGLMCGARVSNLKVSFVGGSVTLSKTNVWITLSPYFFPFYTVIVALAALVVRLCAGRQPVPPLWLAAVGFTWCFHLCFTLRALSQRQPDVEEYGRVFSWTLILSMNVLGLIAWTLAATGTPPGIAWDSLKMRVPQAYLAVRDFAVWLWAAVCG